MSDPMPDQIGLFPLMDTTRRGFVVTTLATGFALSIRPAKAVIVTDAAGLDAGEVQIPVSDGNVPAYRAMPGTGGPFPILIVVEEVFGVHEHIKDVCRRFAKKGYLAIAPELYSRLGDVVRMKDIGEVMKTVNRAPDETAFSDLDATIDWAKKNGGDKDRAGMTGFCRGGRMVWMYAAHNSGLKAAAAWYGPLVGPVTDPMPKHPLDVADDLKVPVLGLYGGKDQGISQDSIEAFRAKLKAGSSGSEIIVYPDAQHGFNADYRPSYNQAAAQDGMRRALAWFQAHGLGATAVKG